MTFPDMRRSNLETLLKLPPKLAVIPKAIKAYRNCRGWASQPGSQLPSTLGSTLSLWPSFRTIFWPYVLGDL
ncbi:hypothetical protein EUGRSUZ_E01355 [Eucalyptus grandis]|uniref:Uncharacterized protein n=2 Tax=Eucalyptus grandis TaxID=71139 RepID=A0ACC3KU89_EUCGR|nr:hypothetical protein EUGRSUZ_E01355 [Eucalyptus grandis]